MSDIEVYEFEHDFGEGDQMINFVMLDDFNDLQAQLKEAEETINEQKEANKELLSALENIAEYNSMIPLHTEDAHALHFVEQIELWCDKASAKYEVSK